MSSNLAKQSLFDDTNAFHLSPGRKAFVEALVSKLIFEIRPSGDVVSQTPEATGFPAIAR